MIDVIDLKRISSCLAAVSTLSAAIISINISIYIASLYTFEKGARLYGIIFS